MKIDCRNGFFIFNEDRAGQIADFIRWSGLELVKWRDAYTFSGLELAPEYSILGTPFFNLVATATYQGEPWDLFEENAVVFNFLTGLVVPMATITQTVKLSQAGNKYIANGLFLPGSLLPDGKRIKSYSGYFSRDTLNFNYSEVEIE
jgi:hypothetical protein